MKKSIIIPSFNEEKGLPDVVKRCKKVLNRGDEIIVVDDGSQDKTFETAKKLGVRVLKHSKNLGKTSALKTGFNAAKNDVIVTIDGDATYPPEKIPDLVKELENADLVVGTRFRKMWPKDLSWIRVAANKLGALFASVLFQRKITDVTTGMRAFRKNVLKKIPEIRAKGLDFEAELTSRAITSGLEYREVRVIPELREGQSNLQFFSHMWLFFKAIIRGKFF